MKPSPRAESESVRRTFLETVREENLFSPGDRILVALSGGKDSVCLLNLLNNEKDSLGVTLCACHVHHGMRKSATRDERFCKALCQTLGVEYHARYVNVPEYREAHGLSPEQAARHLRYGALLELAGAQNALVATAHTASDNTETVLLSLLRGGSMKTLSGIAPKRLDGVIRPLIRLSSQDVRAYCKENHLSFLSDETNRDTRLPRNFLRREIIPKLKRRNPNLDRTVLTLSQTVRAQKSALDAHFAASRKKLGIEKSDRGAPVEVLMPLLKSEPTRALLYDLLNGFLSAAGNREPLSAERYDAVCRVLEGGKSDKRVEVNGNYSFSFAGMLYAEKACDAENPEPIELDLAALPREFEYAGNSFSLCSGLDEKETNVYKFHTTCVLDCDKIIGKLCVRLSKPDDSISVNGREKRVSDLMSGRMIPLGMRSRYPVFSDDSGVLWVPGELPCDRVRTTGKSADPMTIRLSDGEIYEILLQKRRQYE